MYVLNVVKKTRGNDTEKNFLISLISSYIFCRMVFTSPHKKNALKHCYFFCTRIDTLPEIVMQDKQGAFPFL